MNYLQALILAVVEGLSEFLPISSTGHLVLTSKLLNIEQTDFVKSFEIIIQLGAILAIIFLYRKTLLINKEVLKRIAVAFIPTAIAGFVLYDIVKQILIGNVFITVSALFIGGILLILLEFIHSEKEYHKDQIIHLTFFQCLYIGIFQALSIIPGVSRAAATIIGALFLGAKRKVAVEFSFLLAIPTMAGATGLDVLKSNFSFSLHEYSLLAVGFLVSFLVAIFAVKFFLQFIQHNNFIPFGIYRIILSLVFFLLFIK